MFSKCDGNFSASSIWFWWGYGSAYLSMLLQFHGMFVKRLLSYYGICIRNIVQIEINIRSSHANYSKSRAGRPKKSLFRRARRTKSTAKYKKKGLMRRCDFADEKSLFIKIIVYRIERITHCSQKREAKHVAAKRVKPTSHRMETEPCRKWTIDVCTNHQTKINERLRRMKIL